MGSEKKKSQNDFHSDLQEMIEQIESIRKIKMITESEYGSVMLMKEDLDKKQSEIDSLKGENDKLKKDKREKDDLNGRIKELEKTLKEENIKRVKLLWWTIGGILGVFSFCAIWLLIRTPYIVNIELQILLLLGGIIVLLLLAVIVIFLGKTIRQIIDNTNKEVL